VTLRPFAQPVGPDAALSSDADSTDAGAYSGQAGASGATGASGKPAGGSAGTAGAAAGAKAQPILDASVPTRSDAGLPNDAGLRSDAGTQPIDAGSPSCGGALVFNICWYLGAESRNCQDTCAAHGGYDAQSAAHIGIPAQGGSLSDCTQVLSALGRQGTVGESTRSDGNGFGCHVWQESANHWLSNPAFDQDVQPPQGAPVRMACGCER
jgi:hypothetical protein